MLIRFDALAARTLTAPHSMLAYLTLSAECEAAHFYRGAGGWVTPLLKPARATIVQIGRPRPHWACLRFSPRNLPGDTVRSRGVAEY
jgi:hypothetical protein